VVSTETPLASISGLDGDGWLSLAVIVLVMALLAVQTLGR
jgi:hypothetical protein